MESSKLKSKVKLKFETLNAATKIEGFDCGDVRLNEFVRDRMLKEQEQGASAVHCAVDIATGKMLAFYTLSTISVDKTELGVKFPYKQVPAIKLGRLAVDVSLQGNGVGLHMVAGAIVKVASIAKEAGVHSLVVDAVRDKIGFYSSAGFTVIRDVEGERTVFMALSITDISTEKV